MIIVFFTDIIFGVLLYYILFVQGLWMAPASKGALLNIHYYYYYIRFEKYWKYYLHVYDSINILVTVNFSLLLL